MHAYLIVTNNQELRTPNIDKILQKNGIKETLEFALSKIDDVRELNSFTSLKVSRPTAVLIKGIENATTEAGNAFLKNLEEPQENLYYILTASSTKKVLPTIVSRCQIVKTTNNQQPTANTEQVEKFLKMTTGEKLAHVDKIKDREEAVEFVNQFILDCHSLLHKGKGGEVQISRFLKAGIATLKNLKANGNVTLQLANFVISLV